ncbi:hypothetical protein [sulfur-oxidizing endosymbiont of Gigantopelta aegis]|uniref:hypothetical protein n=1 Tax=sulfur-oxidizing endosymbiont of Gigantopelta aegis TaxID=2794934 RepID=UPI0018DEA64F|nr:hypothetical protein [sulfur-oxidizing endosymbiont of Gigantopelta aegis]
MTQTQANNTYSVDVLMLQARQLAANYRRATGKTLAGVTSHNSLCFLLSASNSGKFMCLNTLPT